MSRLRMGGLLAVATFALSGCFFSITPDRFEEGDAGVTEITVSSTTPCDPGDAVSVFADGTLVGSTVADGSGLWSLTIPVDTPAIAGAGAYSITASCDSSPLFNTEELIVEPAFEPTVSPDTFVVETPPAKVVVEGSWCVNSLFGGIILSEGESAAGIGPGPGPFDPPSVEVSFNGETLDVVSLVQQPFGETWSFDFDAPAAPGMYPVDITCTFFDDDVAGPSFKTAELLVDVLGVMENAPASPSEDDPVTVSNKDSSPCTTGDVMVSVDDGSTVTDETVTPDVDGHWTLDLGELAPGDYDVTAACAAPTVEDLVEKSAGEVAATAAFAYEPIAFTVAAAEVPVTTPTTEPAGDVDDAGAEQTPAAQPTPAQPRFTG